MKEKKCNSIIKQLKVVILILAIIMTNLSHITVHAGVGNTQYVENIDFSNFSNWRSGVYSFTTGAYEANNQRLCLNDYVQFKGTKYKIHISNSEYRLLIRELDCNKNYITSYQLSNGQEYKPGTRAVYLAIGIYRYAGEHGINYTTYKNLFNNGFVAELVSTDISQTVTGGNSSGAEDNSSSNEEGNDSSLDDYECSGSEEVKEEDTYKSVEDTDFTSFSNWRTGIYNWTNGKYCTWSSRICLNDYVTFESSKYTVNVSNTNYHMLIRELDENMKFIKSYDLADGAIYTPSAQAVYLGISIYNKYSESGISYKTYKNLFTNGFTAELEGYKITTDITEDFVIIETPVFNSNSMCTTQKATVYDLLEKMIKTGDDSVKDISAYNMTYTEFYTQICPKLRENLKVEFSAYRNLIIEAEVSGLYVVSCWLNGVDSDAKGRVERVRESVDAFLETVDSSMSEVEKVLLAHEYIVTHTAYKLDDAGISYSAGGPLGNGLGVCSGYAKAMIVLLEELGIEAKYASSSRMNHGWVYANIDGFWYHIDPTWDDTRKGTNNVYMHRFLLRNDEEFSTLLTGNLHYGWTNFTQKAVSQRYTDWYVHDVAGTMYYYNGMWYYWDINTNSILCSNIEGTITKVVVDGSECERIKLGGITGNVLSYYVGSTQHTRSL